MVKIGSNFTRKYCCIVTYPYKKKIYGYFTGACKNSDTYLNRQYFNNCKLYEKNQYELYMVFVIQLYTFSFNFYVCLLKLIFI